MRACEQAQYFFLNPQSRRYKQYPPARLYYSQNPAEGRRLHSYAQTSIASPNQYFAGVLPVSVVPTRAPCRLKY